MKEHILTQNEILTRFTLLFDDLLELGKERDIHRIINSYNSKDNEYENNKNVRIRNIFFIWIGCLRSNSLEYINIWEKYASKFEISIYIDMNFLLFENSKDIFNATYNITKHSTADYIIECQNHFRKTLSYKMKLGLSFDDSLISISKPLFRNLSHKLENTLRLRKLKIDFLKENYHIFDISNCGNIFFDQHLKNMYIQELTLRGNPAAAADILRLSILYNKGGIYIDVDTLPPMKYIYGPISEGINPNIVNVVRSEYFLRNWREHHGLGKERNIDLSELENYLSVTSHKTLKDIRITSKKIQSIDFSIKDIYVNRDLISIAGLEKPHEYNNNVLISSKHSRLTRIILREVKRRYIFIHKNKYDLGIKNEESSCHELYRLSNYRYDTFDDRNNVTLFLTGPSVILEVLLSVAYEVLDIDHDTSARALSYALRLNCVSISFSEHTNYTPEHMKSSWM